MVSSSLKPYLEPGSIIIGFVIGVVLVAAVALYWIGLLHMQPADDRLDPDQDPIPQMATSLFDREILSISQSTETTSGFLRKSRVYEILEQADEEQLLDLMIQSEVLEDESWRQAIQSFTLRRLAAISPQKALSLSMPYPMQQRRWMFDAVFGEWSVADLSGAVTAGAELDDVNREFALRSILRTRTDLPEVRRLTIGRQIANDELAHRLVVEESVPLLTEAPQTAWNSVLASGAELVPMYESLVDIAERWIELDGVRALRPILESLSNRLGARVLARELITAIAQGDPVGTFDQLLRIPGQSEALVKLTGNWAASDGVAALNSVALVEDYKTRRDLTFVVMRRWAESDPKGLFAQRSQFPPELQLEVVNLAISKVARRDSEEAINLIGNLQDEGVNTWAAENSLVQASAAFDPRSTLDWLLNESSSSNPYRMGMLRKTITELARKDPSDAMEAALEQPIDSTGPIEESVIEVVSVSDIETAIELLKQVREEGKRDSFHHVGRALLEDGESLQAMDLAQLLHEHERDSYYRDLLQTWAHSNPDQLLHDLPDLPSDLLRSLAALSLLRSNANSSMLDSDQMEHIESQLLPEHLDELNY